MVTVILLGKRYDQCHWADTYLRGAWPDARVESYLRNRGDPFPERGSWEADVLLSFLSPWVVPRRVLDQVGTALNFHPGPPEYPGFGCYNFALYDGVEEYGVTCHRMDERIDHGAIVDVRRFAVQSDCTAFDLQRRSLAVLKELFEEVIRDLANGTLAQSEERWAGLARTREDFEHLRRIPMKADRTEVRRRIRAFSHPSHEGAYLSFHGIEFHPLPRVDSDCHGNS